MIRASLFATATTARFRPRQQGRTAGAGAGPDGAPEAGGRSATHGVRRSGAILPERLLDLTDWPVPAASAARAAGGAGCLTEPDTHDRHG